MEKKYISSFFFMTALSFGQSLEQELQVLNQRLTSLNKTLDITIKEGKPTDKPKDISDLYVFFKKYTDKNKQLFDQLAKASGIKDYTLVTFEKLEEYEKKLEKIDRAIFFIDWTSSRLEMVIPKKWEKIVKKIEKAIFIVCQIDTKDAVNKKTQQIIEMENSEIEEAVKNKLKLLDKKPSIVGLMFYYDSSSFQTYLDLSTMKNNLEKLKNAL